MLSSIRPMVWNLWGHLWNAALLFWDQGKERVTHRTLAFGITIMTCFSHYISGMLGEIIKSSVA